MSFQCKNPIVAVNIGINPDTGKNKLSFRVHLDDNIGLLKERFGEDNVFTLPCGRCESCRINYAEDWSIRCTLEAQYHPYNYFLTLTYANEFLPYGGYKDVQKFFDRLEGFKHKNKFKYFGCLEFGESTCRLHYHIVLFMDSPLTLKDETIINGFKYYHADEITDAWTFGLHNIAPFEGSCARYVAKYTMKADEDKKSKIFMSKGLGRKYFNEHYQEIIDNNFVIYGDFQKKVKHVYIPRSMFYWFKDSGCIEINNYQEFKKNLGKLYSSYTRRMIVNSHEEESMKYRQALEEKRQKGRRIL